MDIKFDYKEEEEQQQPQQEEQEPSPKSIRRGCTKRLSLGG